MFIACECNFESKGTVRSRKLPTDRGIEEYFGMFVSFKCSVDALTATKILLDQYTRVSHDLL